MIVVARPRRRPGAGSTRCRDAGAEIDRRRRRDPAERVAAALAELGRRGITSLFLEGGATLAAAFAAAGEIDEARVFVAPLLLGGPARGLAGVPGPARRAGARSTSSARAGRRGHL